MFKKVSFCFFALLLLFTSICFAEEEYPLIFDNHNNFLVRVKKDTIKPVTIDNKQYLTYYVEGKKREFFTTPWGIPIPVGTTKVAEEWRIYDVENKTSCKLPKNPEKFTVQELASLVYDHEKMEKENFLDQRLLDYTKKNIPDLIPSIIEENKQNEETFLKVKNNRIISEEIDEIPKSTEKLKKLIKKSETGEFPKVYNAGKNFEWSNEEDKINFENLPFTDNIQELASHVYKLQWDAEDRNANVGYVMFVPRHVQYGYDGEIKDQLVMIQLGLGGKICNRGVCSFDEKGNPIVEVASDSKFRVAGIFQGDILETVSLEEEEWSYFEEPQREKDIMGLQSVTVLGGAYIPTHYKLVPTKDPRIIDMVVTADSPFKKSNARLIKLEEVKIN